MGTRSLTVMKDDEQEIAVLYRQFDGYPDGHGLELANFLAGFRVVNGFGEVTNKLANGGGCLAAQIVAHFKDGVGGFYLYPAGSRDCGEDYLYTVECREGEEPAITVQRRGGATLYSGPASKVAADIEKGSD